MRPVRIANFSGYFGDRLEAFDEALATPGVDVVTGDYLAEVTLYVLAKLRERDPSRGHATTFLKQLDSAADRLAERRVPVVVNAGGLNPAGLAAAVGQHLHDRGHDLRVAAITGDDLLPRIDDLRLRGESLEHLRTGEAVATHEAEPVVANAYLGAWGIVEALDRGADIVLCGRVTDASLVVGPAAWWHGWKRKDLDQLAGAVVAGHVIECGTQATGGNLSSFGRLDADLNAPGYPIAEIQGSGDAVITKPEGTGGAVTVDTVTAQLVYEIDRPIYLNPDVAVDLSGVQVEQVGKNRVSVYGARGLAPPRPQKLRFSSTEAGWPLSNMYSRD